MIYVSQSQFLLAKTNEDRTQVEIPKSAVSMESQCSIENQNRNSIILKHHINLVELFSFSFSSHTKQGIFASITQNYLKIVFSNKVFYYYFNNYLLFLHG